VRSIAAATRRRVNSWRERAAEEVVCAAQQTPRARRINQFAATICIAPIVTTPA